MQILQELSVGGIAARLAAVLLYAALQGGVLAFLAWLFGDRRPSEDGRLTLNPFAHVSAWGAAMAALFAVSWVRSVWYDRAQNRLGRGGTALVVVLGWAAMLLVPWLAFALGRLAVLLPFNGATAALLVLSEFQAITVASLLLNALPVPGLVAGGLWQALWPGSERRLRRWEPICMALVIAAIVAFDFPRAATITATLRGWF